MLLLFLGAECVTLVDMYYRQTNAMRRDLYPGRILKCYDIIVLAKVRRRLSKRIVRKAAAESINLGIRT